MSLPPELWLHVHALATAETSPLALSRSTRFHSRYEDLSNPFKAISDFYGEVRNYALVNRLWNALATEILYENLVVNTSVRSLLQILQQRPYLARCVRTIRLSKGRFDDNMEILRLCVAVQVVVQPDNRDSPSPSRNNSEPIYNPAQWKLPDALQALTHIFWIETDLSTGMLSHLLRLAPNLARLSINESTRSATWREPLLGGDGVYPHTGNCMRVHYLTMGQHTGWDATRAILKLDLSSLTTLQCAPAFIAHADFPATLPRLHTLQLAGFRSQIPFARIFAEARFPALRDLAYSIWDSFVPLSRRPPASAPALRLRLTSALSLRRVVEWKPINDHFVLILGPAFPRVERLVLYGAWDWILKDARFGPIREEIRARGYIVEHPEGKLLV